MNRIDTLHQISRISEDNCKGCMQRAEIIREHGHIHFYVDRHCTKVCPIGAELKRLGSLLEGRRKG
ncbi:zinc-finger domain-containing protein [Paenibacillus tianjinensis]|uniref:Zinc-finger domain-containing protein n=1 Tax=Paenibacillus tianjinensis TaxID=2810347 RepID=A0ABX7L607_9BACL|nr:zinc-finger domain-containing protein [Paenibacillus tianjinensis]QSF42686.1 zinc-finger domain-containing protein [Paenibacillus tianjinensis]